MDRRVVDMEALSSGQGGAKRRHGVDRERLWEGAGWTKKKPQFRRERGAGSTLLPLGPTSTHPITLNTGVSRNP